MIINEWPNGLFGVARIVISRVWLVVICVHCISSKILDNRLVKLVQIEIFGVAFVCRNMLEYKRCVLIVRINSAFLFVCGCPTSAFSTVGRYVLYSCVSLPAEERMHTTHSNALHEPNGLRERVARAILFNCRPWQMCLLFRSPASLFWSGPSSRRTRPNVDVLCTNTKSTWHKAPCGAATSAPAHGMRYLWHSEAMRFRERLSSRRVHSIVCRAERQIVDALQIDRSKCRTGCMHSKSTFHSKSSICVCLRMLHLVQRQKIKLLARTQFRTHHWNALITHPKGLRAAACEWHAKAWHISLVLLSRAINVIIDCVQRGYHMSGIFANGTIVDHLKVHQIQLANV